MNQPKILYTQVRDVAFGKNVTVVEPGNLYECKFGDDCFIGPFVEIQKGVVIGNRCKIQSHSFVCELVRIGDDCIISHGVVFINDPFQLVARHMEIEIYGNQPTLATKFQLGRLQLTVLPVKDCDNVASVQDLL